MSFGGTVREILIVLACMILMIGGLEIAYSNGAITAMAVHWLTGTLPNLPLGLMAPLGLLGFWAVLCIFERAIIGLK